MLDFHSREDSHPGAVILVEQVLDDHERAVGSAEEEQRDGNMLEDLLRRNQDIQLSQAGLSGGLLADQHVHDEHDDRDDGHGNEEVHRHRGGTAERKELTGIVEEEALLIGHVDGDGGQDDGQDAERPHQLLVRRGLILRLADRVRVARAAEEDAGKSRQHEDHGEHRDDVEKRAPAPGHV